jgi:F0F1-type ATP synthase membrane subunit c/vacuolar-type H+-ATPase subunit K
MKTEQDSASPMKASASYPPGTGIAIGLAIGVALGIAFDNLAIGIGCGIAIGAGIDANAQMKKKDGEAQNTPGEK